MKKKIFILSFVFLFTVHVSQLLAFEISFFPVGYMNHTVTIKYNPNTFGDTLKSEIESAFGELTELGSIESKDSYHAYALGVDMRLLTFFYTGVRIGLPTRIYRTGTDPMESVYKNIYDKGAQKVKSVIVDGQVGICYPINFNKLTVSLGIGAALNYVKVEHKLNRNIHLKDGAFMTNVVDHSEIFQTGVGANLSLQFRFSYRWGLNLALTDSFIFYSMINKRFIQGDVGDVRMKLEFKGSKDSKSFSKNNDKFQYGNNFALMLGISIST